MADRNADLQELANLPFFRSFDEEALRLMSGLGNRQDVDAGVTFLHQGEKGESMYVLLAGTVAVKFRDVRGYWRELARIEAGNFFGEVALMDEGPRCADIVTLEPCRIMEISHSDISLMALGNPKSVLDLFVTICRELVDRERYANIKYAEALAASGAPP